MSRQRQDDIAHPHYALIYIDGEGNLRPEMSQSIPNSRETILSAQFVGAFLRAVADSTDIISSHSPFQLVPSASSPRATPSAPVYPPSQTSCSPRNHEIRESQSYPRVPVPRQHLIQPIQRRARKELWPKESDMADDEMVPITLRSKNFLRRYYEKIFQNIQQANCRVLAKAYIKLIEPRKHVNYPYNGRKIVAGRTRQLSPDETKPPWWPSGVSHREPDHLPKAVNTAPLHRCFISECLKPADDPKNVHGISAQRMKEADRPIRKQFSPPGRLQILDEAYRVREGEEKLLDGTTGTSAVLRENRIGRSDSLAVDGNTTMLISRANLPDAAEPSVSNGKSGQKGMPATETPSREPESKAGTDRIHGGTVSECITLQAALAPHADTSVPASGDIHPISYCPTWYIEEDVPMHTNHNFNPAAAPTSQRHLHRNEEYVDAFGTTSYDPNHTAYLSSIFMGDHPFLPESYDEQQGFPNLGVPSSAHPVLEPNEQPRETYLIPCYFDS
ncbi:hypothetical protein N7451_012755 [Penicillium sp. IBT 35674x]|nr:hypothetical protein N7451_012755 [Penicillium sp. IBT 35674x]